MSERTPHGDALHERIARAELDAILTRVRRLLDVPIAFVSWVEDGAILTSAAEGLGTIAMPRMEATEVALAALATTQATTVEDTQADARARRCSLVGTPPHVGAYLGAPISFEGRTVGVISGASLRPRAFSTRELETLATLADAVGHALTLERMRREQATLEEALSTIRQAEASKSRFLGVLSHEMRTPLSSMIGSIELAASSEGDERRLALERARRSGRGLLRFTEDVLDFARTHSGSLRLSPQPGELRVLLDEVAATAREVARGKQVRFGFVVAPDVPSIVEMDAQRVAQVLGNLLSNAIKVAPTGRVKMEVRLGATEPSAPIPVVEFIVSDDGPGIAKEDQARIFEPFEQLALGRSVGGTGLGLSISRALVQQMGGAITVVSDVGAGAVFTVRIPMPASRRRVATSASSLPRLFRGARVLVVDDDEDNRFVLTRFLERAGCLVESTDDPQHAIERARDPGLQAVVTDNAMPRMDGPALARAIRQAEGAEGPNRRRIRIVGVTADADASTRDRCLAAGMDAWLIKPVSARALLDAVMGQPPEGEVEQPPPRSITEPLSSLRDSSMQARVERYLERRTQDLEEIRRALLVGDVTLIARIGHNLRGSGGSFGFPRLTELGGELEDAAKNGALNIIATTLQTLEAELARAQMERAQRKS